jgi:hypothetical protein
LLNYHWLVPREIAAFSWIVVVDVVVIKHTGGSLLYVPMGFDVFVG